MNVLVIGGAGYIGSALTAHLLDHGHRVTVLDLLLFGGESLSPLAGRPDFRLVQGDLRREDTLADVIPEHDAVVLLAAIVGEPACNRDPKAAVDTNLDGARKVLEASRQAGVARFVFSSTCSNYGISDCGDLVTEEAPLRPLSIYSETKVTAERAILAAATDSFHPTVLRFSTAFGVSPRMRFDLLVSDFTLAAVRDRRVVVYGEQFWRPFVHVQDISSAVTAVLHADPARVSGEVFNTGSNQANTQKIELAREVQKQVAGTELDFVELNHDPRSYRVDFSKIEARLGVRARWTVPAGVSEVHRALRKRAWSDPTNPRYYN